VLWNALAPELWRRTTITIQRALSRLVGLDEAGLRRLVRVSYAKVAEFQRRGAIHFHAVLRLDAATECRCPGCLAPPPEPFTAALLEDSPRQAVPAVRVPCPPLDEGPGRYARWGEQLDVRNISRADGETGELSAEQVAGYIAKYATKATESFGAGLDRRLTAPDDLEHLDGLPAHVVALVEAAWWALGGRPSWTACGCGPGRTCWGSGATGRPKAAATPPPSPSCAAPAWRSPSAAGPATASPWTPSAEPKTTRP
jgi:hypothetical protein